MTIPVRRLYDVHGMAALPLQGEAHEYGPPTPRALPAATMARPCRPSRCRGAAREYRGEEIRYSPDRAREAFQCSMANAQWQMLNGKCSMANAQWEMLNGKCS